MTMSLFDPSTSLQRDSLTILPYDVLFDVLCRVQIADVIALRLTCSSLRDVSLSRALWVYHFRNYVKDELLMPAHMLCDLDDPQTDAAHIERIVMACARMTHTLMTSPTLPAPTSVIQEAFTSPNLFTKLLPGGRFLVIGALDSPGQSLASTVSLWDLSTGKNTPAATVRYEMPVLQCNFVSTKEMDVIRLVVSSGHRFFGFEVHVIEVRWPAKTAASPELVKMATLPDVPVAPIRLAIDDDIVFFTTPSPVIVWNWRTDAMAAGVITDHSRSLGLVQRYPHVVRADSRYGSLSPYILPQPSIRPPSSTVGDPDVSRVFFVFPLKQTGTSMPGDASTSDASPLHGWWRPTSVTNTMQMATVSSSHLDDEASELNLYDWTPPTGVVSPNEEVEREREAAEAAGEGEETARPKKTEESSKPKEPVEPPTPGRLKRLTTISIPTTERLRDLLVTPLNYSHHTRAFLAVCAPDADKAGSMAVRVAYRDGNVKSHKIGMWPELPDKWHAGDTMMFDPHSGRLVAVTATSIMTFEL